MNTGVTVSTSAASSATAPLDYPATVAAMVLVLELLERRMATLRDECNLSRHAAAHGHLRSAIDYERRVLADLQDPRGMCAATSRALRTLTPQAAIGILNA